MVVDVAAAPLDCGTAASTAATGEGEGDRGGIAPGTVAAAAVADGKCEGSHGDDVVAGPAWWST